MRTSASGEALIRGFEHFAARAYLPTPDDVPTIGYGTTVYPNGKRVGLTDPAVTPAQAAGYLDHDLRAAEAVVSKLVTAVLSQDAFDALVSFVYNLGQGALAGSTLLKKLNGGDRAGAADEFLRWDHQGGRVLAGLTRRRRAERQLFLS